MNSIEYSIHKKRTEHRRKRNVIRRFFLFVSILIIAIFLYQLYLLPAKTDIPVVFEKNKLLNTELIKSQVEEYVNGKNFYLISLNKLSKEILDSCTLLKNIIIRKYIFPKCQFVAYVVEKDVWGMLKPLSGSNYGMTYFISSEGNLILPEYVVEENIEDILILLTAKNSDDLTPVVLNIAMKNLLLMKDKFMLEIKEVSIEEDNKMTITCMDDLIIKAGKINDGLYERTGRLQKALEIAHDKGLVLQYIDLTLEKSVVFKEKDITTDKSNEGN